MTTQPILTEEFGKITNRQTTHLRTGRARRFTYATRVNGAQSTSVQIAVCGNCGLEGYLNVPYGGMKDNAVEEKFRQRHWFIGARIKDDRCPRCHEIAKEARRKGGSGAVAGAMAAAQGKKEHEEFVKMTTTPKPSTVTPLRAVEGASQEPPREMSREDRRIIFAKLQDVYIDEKSGYADQWTDITVAKDLNVPRAWIEQIREENFGPVKSNAEITQFLQQAGVVTAAATKCLDEARDIWAKTNALNTNIQDGRRAVEALTKMAERIAKAVGA